MALQPQPASAPSLFVSAPSEHVTINAANCRVNAATAGMRVAVGFYGLFRNLSATHRSINENLLAPLSEFAGGPVDVFVHSMQATSETEFGQQAVAVVLNTTRSYLELPACRAAATNQTLVDEAYDLPAHAAAEHAYVGPRRNGFGSASYNSDTYLNLIRAKFSLWRVSKLILKYEEQAGFQYTHVVEARPDTGFPVATTFLPMGAAHVRVPNFAQGSGVNDRFAYGRARTMLRVKMAEFRTQFVERVLVQKGRMFSPLVASSERVVCRMLRDAHVVVGVLPICVVRVSASGDAWMSDVSQFREDPWSMVYGFAPYIGDTADSEVTFFPGPVKGQTVESALYVASPESAQYENACNSSKGSAVSRALEYGWGLTGGEPTKASTTAGKPSAAPHSYSDVAFAASEPVPQLLSSANAQPPGSGSSLCVSGVAMPQLFILGMEKAGTSEIETWLNGTGLVADACPRSNVIGANSTTGPECHAYDALCGFNELAGGSIGACPSSASEPDAAVAQYDHDGYPCGASPSGKILVDKSPTYSRLLGLPAYLQSEYGRAQAERLRFVVILREPLDRMISALFWRSHAKSHTRKIPAFVEGEEYLVANDYVEKLAAKLPSTYAALTRDIYQSPIARDYENDCFYRSLYAVQLQPWLSSFDPKQLLVLPFGWAMANQVGSVSLMMSLLGTTGSSLTSARVESNEGHELSADEVLSNRTQQYFRSTFFAPDTIVLSGLLAKATQHGLVVGSDSDRRCVTAQGCYDVLTGSW